MRNPKTVLWLQSGGCGGCTMSMMCAEAPGLFPVLESFGLDFLWHPSLSEESGDEVQAVLSDVIAGRRPLDILCFEGSVLRGPNGSGRFHILAGTGRPMIEWLRELAPLAKYVVGVGSCAAYGGITAAGNNPADAVGLQFEGRNQGGALGADFRSRSGLPVINIAGCPTHPNWVTETLMLLSEDALSLSDLDPLRRPRFYSDHLVHHGCSRNEYYEYKASAEELSEIGCMMENLGCIGTQAHGDCNTRAWNGEGSCTRGGYPCINCTAPEFEEPGRVFTETPKIGGIPIGLPTDMPKAWFIALASLSKAATPKRVKLNAVADYIVAPPTDRDTNLK
ncbi:MULTISPECIES: HupU protein [unclassified Hyphomicrobium]|uniref:NADH-quinone oxidoreductase subunit B family protein n=1 Tax=unclassified Hyphomicrobium TaxID=2619925 RepID=UPI000213F75F|nr:MULTISPECIES: HupU protein [unclassified Hyphomicrobium]CCB63692.1 HupU protein [Hyphomicrobium sp. MC1]